MEPRLALIGIIVEHTESVEKINALLHEYGEYIIGRMGVPHAKRKVFGHQCDHRRPGRRDQRAFRKTRHAS